MNDTVIKRMMDMPKLYQMGEVTVNALKDVSLSVELKQGTVILGPSESGMTTLLEQIGSIDSPISRKIWVKGGNISKMNEIQADIPYFQPLGLNSGAFSLQNRMSSNYFGKRDYLSYFQNYSHKVENKIKMNVEFSEIQEKETKKNKAKKSW